ncbi:MAG: amidase [Planctomycetes bacterium]|nr:amidase [Planctomycetota bacterium]
MHPERRRFLQAGLWSGLAVATGTAPVSGMEVKPSELDESTVADLQAAMDSKKFTARFLTATYLARIDAFDNKGPAVNSVIEVNPEALTMAEQLDQERQARGTRGPWHGIPVLIKDNIATADRMATTAGSLALVGARPPADSFLVKRLRRAGAVLLGKTNLSEWANIRSSHSTSGWSGRGGLTRNPYALDRNPGGSSSGSGAAVAANFCVAAVGTETDGSIMSPSSANGIVGLKPTVGLVSRSGVIPISHSQDTPGPMARTVRDAALLLGVLAGEDPEDKATSAGRSKSFADYTRFLDPHGLRGARVGVVRQFFGFHGGVDGLMEKALGVMKHRGAVLVDPVLIPTLGQVEDSELLVFLYELKAGLNAYLDRLGRAAPVHSLQEIIEFNERHRQQEMPYFGQDLFVKAQAKGPLTSKEYRTALELNHRLARQEGIDAVMDRFKLDALVAPTGGPAWVTDLVNGDHSVGTSTPAAVAGYPSITVPAGFIFGLPVGISFFGRAWSEPTLLKLAYAFEQATTFRQPPRFLPTANLS